MNVAVLNAGSGSQVCDLFKLPEGDLGIDPREPDCHARLDSTAPGQAAGQIRVAIRKGRESFDSESLSDTTSTEERVTHLLRSLWSGPAAVIAGPEEVHAVAHRIVHGGADFGSAVLVDEEVEKKIEEAIAFAPLHNPTNLKGIRAVRALLGEAVPQVSVFDTAFHSSLPAAARTYPGPYEWVEKGIRRYGFHGSSFRWSSYRAASLLGRAPDDPSLRLLLCHLGGGCSLCATAGGRSIDTTMGFTPLDGIAMCTRSGAVDPGILIHLLRGGMSTSELERLLNHESGLKGLSGRPGDTRVILPAARQGDQRAQLAMEVFIHRLRAGMGEMIASLGAVPDAIVFTDAIAEDEPWVIAEACRPFAFLGVQLDHAKNERSPADTDIASAESKVRVLLVKSRETWQIARECHDLLSRRFTSKASD